MKVEMISETQYNVKMDDREAFNMRSLVDTANDCRICGIADLIQFMLEHASDNAYAAVQEPFAGDS